MGWTESRLPPRHRAPAIVAKLPDMKDAELAKTVGWALEYKRRLINEEVFSEPRHCLQDDLNGLQRVIDAGEAEIKKRKPCFTLDEDTGRPMQAVRELHLGEIGQELLNLLNTTPGNWHQQPKLESYTMNHVALTFTGHDGHRYRLVLVPEEVSLAMVAQHMAPA